MCKASTTGYKVRARRQNTIIVSVQRNGTPLAGTKVTVTLTGGRAITRATGKDGKVTLTVKPSKAGTILVRSPTCNQMLKVKVYAAKPVLGRGAEVGRRRAA